MLRLALILTLAILSFSSPAMAQVVEGDDGPIRLGRFEYQGKIWYGFLSVGGMHQLDRSYFDENAKRTGKIIPLKDLHMLAPVVPRKIIAIALNYKSHGGRKAEELQFFAKLPSSIIATGQQIIPPPNSTSLHYEGELVVVIGKKAKNVSVKQADDYIFGVTIGNDVTERSYPFAPFDLLRSKSSDTFAPLGPWIVPGLSYDNLQLITRLNGEVVQNSSTKRMIFSVRQIVSRLSRYITLEQGDVIYTGTPGRTRAMKTGDKIEVSLEGVGVLRNTVGKRVEK